MRLTSKRYNSLPLALFMEKSAFSLYLPAGRLPLTMAVHDRAKLQWVPNGYDMLDARKKVGQDMRFEHLSSFFNYKDFRSPFLE